MFEEAVNAGGAGAGAGTGGGGADAGGSGGGSGASEVSSQSDSEALENAALATPESTDATTQETPAADAAGKEADKGATEDAAEEVNLAALEEGRPEWLAKVTDPAAKAEIEKVLDQNKKFAEHFKDGEDLDAFFKDLPGGREQVAALQTLSKEVTELDSALEANTPEGLATVAERYLAMTPDGGAGLVRAAAQQMAKSSPEAWNQLSAELINSTLNAAGIGTDFQGMLGAIEEMRQAVAKDDGEAFGAAAGRLLGTPKAAPRVDPNITRAQEAERAARTAERTAKVQVWESSVTKTVEASQQHVRQAIGTALAAKDSAGKALIPATITSKSREELSERIFKEIDQQLGADSWLVSQINSLVGSRSGDKQNLAATQEHFDKAGEISKAAAARLLPAAVRKHVSAWARELAASSREAIDRAKGNGNGSRREPSGSTPQSKGPRRLGQDDIIGPNAKSDKELLEMSLGL